MHGGRRRPRLVGALGAACALAGLAAVVAGCSGSSGTDYHLGANGVIVPVADRAAAPSLEGRSLLTAGTVSLAQFKGHVTVLNYWGAWCGPCRDEAQGLAAAWKTLAPEGVQFVGLDTRDTDSEAKRFLAANGMTYPQIVDPDGTLQVHFTPLPVQGTPPDTVIIDAQGRVASRFVGETTDSALTATVRTVLAEKA